MRGHDAEIFRCSEHEGLLAGHLLLSWSEAGEVFGVSLHGYSDENRRLVYGIADSIEVVEPTVESTPSSSVPAIELPAGSSSGRAQFEAVDPKAHEQTITVAVQPATVDVDVEFETETGSMLRILSGEDERDCEARGDQRVCTILLPVLEAQRPGTWTAIATKAEGPAASVKIDVLWEEVSCVEGDAAIKPCR